MSVPENCEGDGPGGGGGSQVGSFGSQIGISAGCAERPTAADGAAAYCSTGSSVLLAFRNAWRSASEWITWPPVLDTFTHTTFVAAVFCTMPSASISGLSLVSDART